jgi:hypothetical protein
MAKMKIVEATKDGRLRLRVSSSQGLKQIMDQIDTKSFRITLKGKPSPIRYEIILKDSGNILLRLNFENPMAISSTSV